MLLNVGNNTFHDDMNSSASEILGKSPSVPLQ